MLIKKFNWLGFIVYCFLPAIILIVLGLIYMQITSGGTYLTYKFEPVDVSDTFKSEFMASNYYSYDTDESTIVNGNSEVCEQAALNCIYNIKEDNLYSHVILSNTDVLESGKIYTVTYDDTNTYYVHYSNGYSYATQKEVIY